MELTEQNKKKIDNLTYSQLLNRWRIAPFGDSWLQGETGVYWGEQILKLQGHLAAMKPVQVFNLENKDGQR